jgi:hypothetical protein
MKLTRWRYSLNIFPVTQKQPCLIITEEGNMSERIILECDECGTINNVSNLEFSYAGKDYRLDLCEKCGKEKVDFFKDMIEDANAATKATGSLKTVEASVKPKKTFVESVSKTKPINSIPRRQGRPRKVQSTVINIEPSPSTVRAWAKSQGIEVPERGRLPKGLIVQFSDAGN